MAVSMLNNQMVMAFVLSSYPLTFWPGILHWSCAQWCSVVREVLNYVLFCVLKRRVSTAKRLVHGWFMVMKSVVFTRMEDMCHVRNMICLPMYSHN